MPPPQRRLCAKEYACARMIYQVYVREFVRECVRNAVMQAGVRECVRVRG